MKGDSEILIPVHQVGEQGEIAGVEGVQSRPKDVGDFAFVDEGGQLRLAHGELPAVLDFHVLHRIAVGEDSVFGFIPLNDVDELLAEKALEGHLLLLECNSTISPDGGE